MNVGIVCYGSVGGSGIIATELGKALAARGHHVHLLSGESPARLGGYQPGLVFHRVDSPSYPLFREPQYLLSLANKIVQVSRQERLDIVHAHYAVPHATAAYLAKQILSASSSNGMPRIITTLHGTDITVVGSDRSYTETVAFCIQQSDGVTAVSQSLKEDTIRELGITRDIRVIYNFIDCTRNQRADTNDVCGSLKPPGERLLIHVSNFRPVKRAPAVVEIFARIRKRIRARLLMVGDGPDVPAAMRLAKSLGLSDQVKFLGEQDEVVPLLSAADLFLLPSSEESFGLASLEAMACRVPVVASRVGGIPEVIQDGTSGFLHDPADLDGMAASALKLLTDDELHRRFGDAASRIARDRFCDSKIVPLYEAYYGEVLGTASHTEGGWGG